MNTTIEFSGEEVAGAILTSQYDGLIRHRSGSNPRKTAPKPYSASRVSVTCSKSTPAGC
jgi:hypothetical protein